MGPKSYCESNVITGTWYESSSTQLGFPGQFYLFGSACLRDLLPTGTLNQEGLEKGDQESAHGLLPECDW
jgi:hypothetical protein